MKKSLITLLAIAGLAWSLSSVAYAGEEKTITYLLTKNDVSKKFHENVCTESKKVKVTGTVKEVDGKLELTPTKIDLVKN